MPLFCQLKIELIEQTKLFISNDIKIGLCSLNKITSMLQIVQPNGLKTNNSGSISQTFQKL